MIRGIGMDLVEMERISRLVCRREKFLDRVLTEREKQLLSRTSPERAVEFLAGRFAAKEAAAKALGTGIGAKVGFHDLEILPTKSGKPALHLTDKACATLAVNPASLCIHVSITHTRSYAAAQVIVEEV